MADVWNPHLEASSKILMKFGFIKKEYAKEYSILPEKERNKKIDNLTEDEADKQADLDEEEVGKDQ